MADNKTAPRYPASELIRASSGVQRDVLSVVLKQDKSYSKDEAQKLYDAFLKKGVK